MKLIAQAENEPVVTTPDGAQRRILSYGGKLLLAQFTFDAGVASWHHNHPHEQLGYVVSGEIDFVMDGQETVRLTAGIVVVRSFSVVSAFMIGGWMIGTSAM